MKINKKLIFSKGYEVFNADNIDELITLRKKIYIEAKKIFGLSEKDPEIGFNKLHEQIKGISDINLNEKRKKLIEKITDKINFDETIFKAFENKITKNLGPDIIVQRNCNIVIQMPNDPNPSEIHRDAPLNSAYEIVVWVPLVDCYKSKAMYILDFQSTKKSLTYLKKNKNDWGMYEKFSKKLSSNPKVDFGQGLFFSSCLIHGSDINKENETRISLNIRFKSLFSPSGKKNQLQYFKTLTSNNLTKIGVEFESGELFE